MQVSFNENDASYTQGLYDVNGRLQTLPLNVLEDRAIIAALSRPSVYDAINLIHPVTEVAPSQYVENLTPYERQQILEILFVNSRPIFSMGD